MTALGEAILFAGIYLMYASYQAIHTHVQAAPVTSAKAALK